MAHSVALSLARGALASAIRLARYDTEEEGEKSSMTIQGAIHRLEALDEHRRVIIRNVQILSEEFDCCYADAEEPRTG